MLVVSINVGDGIHRLFIRYIYIGYLLPRRVFTYIEYSIKLKKWEPKPPISYQPTLLKMFNEMV